MHLYLGSLEYLLNDYTFYVDIGTLDVVDWSGKGQASHLVDWITLYRTITEDNKKNTEQNSRV
jgi:hypothetical protein